MPASRLRAFVEAGLLYNSNVSLTPISRQLNNTDASSFQGFLNPELQYTLIDREAIRTGPLTRGYFAVNEQSQRDFDLAAFQGGWFAECDHRFGVKDWISRLDYLYSLDLQGGSRFAERHSLNLSATSISIDGDILYLFGALSLSDFADDGIDPSYDSLDGPGFNGGVTRYVAIGPKCSSKASFRCRSFLRQHRGIGLSLHRRRNQWWRHDRDQRTAKLRARDGGRISKLL